MHRRGAAVWPVAASSSAIDDLVQDIAELLEFLDTERDTEAETLALG
jgi:hypothetical protein